MTHLGSALLRDQQMVGRVQFDDTPELLWDRPVLGRRFDRLREEFELIEQFTALNRMLELVSRTVETPLSLTNARRAHVNMPVLLADLTDPAHQAAIVALLDMYSCDEFGDGKPLSEQARARLIPGLIEHGKARVFLAYDDGEPVGLAICLVGFSSFRGRPLLNIHDIAVAPSARGRGIGRQLLEAIEQDARALGCGKVTLEVRSDNHRAMQLYRRLGFRSSQPETWFWTRTLE